MLPVAVRREALTVVVLLLVIAAIYGQTANFAFTSWDDPSYVTDNHRVKAGLTWAGASWALTATFFSNWHPLTWLSHMAAYEVFQDWAGGHHLVNVGLHAINCLLAFCFFRSVTGDVWRSAAVSVLIAIHPMHTETVAWISDRKGLLAGMFWWSALIAYARYVQNRKATTYFILVGLYAAALMSKPMAVTLPIILLLLDTWPLAHLAPANGTRSAWHALLPRLVDKLPFLLMAAFASAVTIYAQGRGGAVVSQESLPFVDRVTNAFVAVANYLRLLLLPQEISFYFRYADGWPVWKIVVAAIVVVSVSFLCFWLRRSRPALIVGWLWFLVMLLPVIGIVQVGGQAMAARYMYVTSTGIFLAIVWGVPWERLTSGRPKRAAVAVAIGVGLAFIIVAARQTAHWRTSESLFTHALAVDGDNYVAHLLLSEFLVDEGRLAEAEPHARRAIALNEGVDVQTYGLRALGRIALARGQGEEARRLFGEALKLKRTSPLTIYYMAMADLAAGRLSDAERSLALALALRPVFGDGLAALAEVRVRQGRFDEAESHFQQALTVEPRNTKLRLKRAAFLSSQGRFVEAGSEYRQVIDIDSTNAVARQALARLGMSVGSSR